MKNVSYLTLIVLTLFPFKGYSQQEKVHLDLDKYTCHAGDTVWFKGYISRELALSPVSTNLYVEVYAENGALLTRQLFIIRSVIQWKIWPAIRSIFL